MSSTDYVIPPTQVPPVKRRRTRPRPFTASSLLSVLLALAAGIAVLVAEAGHTSVQSVPITDRSLPAGVRLTASDFKAVQMRSADASQFQGLLLPSQVVGRVASVPLVAGEPLTLSDTGSNRPAGSGLGEMSVPISAALADGGNIVAGDRVDVIDAANPCSTYVAQNVLVLSVSSSSSSSALGVSSSSYYLVLAVGKAMALNIATALSTTGNNAVQIVRSTGEKPVAARACTTGPGAGTAGGDQGAKG